MKIIFIGATNVGKTSIVNRIVSNKFYETSSATIGGSFYTVTYKGHSYNIWDTAGQERYASLVPMYYRGANIGVYVIDVSGRIDEEFVNELQSTLFILSYENPECKIILVANKSDVIDPDDLTNKLKMIKDGLSKHNVEVYKVIAMSAKTGSGNADLLATIISVPIVELVPVNGTINDDNGSWYCCS